MRTAAEDKYLLAPLKIRRSIENASNNAEEISQKSVMVQRNYHRNLEWRKEKNMKT